MVCACTHHTGNQSSEDKIMSLTHVVLVWPVPISTWLVVIICLGSQIGGKALAAAPPPQQTMIYEVDPTDLPKGVGGIMDQLVGVASRRLNSDREPLAVVQRLDDRRLQVALMESNKLSKTRVKGLLAMTGTLEFRILADEHDNAAVREIIAQATTHPSERQVLDSGKRPLAWWVPIKVGREAMFVGNAYAGVSRRVLGQGYRQRTELLVLNDAYNITDKHISQARPSNYRNQPCVNITFNPRGGQLFGLLTSSHLPEAATGFMYKLGVILDGQLYSAPAIQSTISDNVELNGSFGQQETEDIARVLHYGRLPARIRLVNEDN